MYYFPILIFSTYCIEKTKDLTALPSILSANAFTCTCNELSLK